MVHWENSYRFGKQQESKILPVIIQYFKKEITPTTRQYAKYDFYDENTNYEAKSRTNKYDKYDSTMITMNKCCKCDMAKDLILLFNFTDGLYFIKYNEEQFSKYYRCHFSRAGEDWDEKEHIYIPITDLSLIERWVTQDDSKTKPEGYKSSGGF